MDGLEILGFAAADLTTASFLPQVYQTWKTKDVSALSLPMLTMFLTGITLWFIYGIYKDSPSLVIANGITIVSVFFLLYFKVKYRNK